MYAQHANECMQRSVCVIHAQLHTYICSEHHWKQHYPGTMCRRLPGEINNYFIHKCQQHCIKRYGLNERITI